MRSPRAARCCCAADGLRRGVRGFYVAMITLLAFVGLPSVGFDYRSKIEDPRWRNV